MFIGHFAPAMVAATYKDAPSLPVLMVAGQLVDWACFSFIMLGIESIRITPGITVMNPMDLYHMPYTHSLVGGVAWAAAFGMIIFLWLKNRTAAIISAGVVVSHWFLDLLVHTKDVTIAGSPPKLGFGLWNYPAIEMPLEIALTMGALWFYASKTGGWRRSVTLLAVTLMLFQAFNWFSPQPTEMSAAIPLSALVAYALLTWLSVSVSRSAR